MERDAEQKDSLTELMTELKELAETFRQGNNTNNTRGRDIGAFTGGWGLLSLVVAQK